MKLLLVLFICALSAVLSGCVSAMRDNSTMAPPAGARAGISDNREIGKIIDCVPAENTAVARIDVGEDVGVGDVFVMRGEDLSPHGVCRVRFAERRTLGLEIIGGDAVIGDFIVVPGEDLSKYVSQFQKTEPQKIKNAADE